LPTYPRPSDRHEVHAAVLGYDDHHG
jgi:hypothetical protein